MTTLSGEKILLTGPAGQIAHPIAEGLARDNEVWGIARFGNPADRERVEKAGVRTLAIDLADPDFGELPDDFDVVLHLAAAISPDVNDDDAITINAEGTGLLMQHVRKARAFLMMSSSSVYADHPVPNHVLVESDPLGGGMRPPFGPAYRVSKVSQEAVARYCARAYGLPTLIARMNAAYGDNGGLPAIFLDMILAGQEIPRPTNGADCASPIHEEDILAHIPGLLAAASVPACITNWGGDDPVDLTEMCRYMGALVGKEPVFVKDPSAIPHQSLDSSRRISLAGPCKVDWRDGVRRMVAARHPEIDLQEP